MKIRMGGKEFSFCPTIADITDEGIIGLDFASLYGAILNPRSGRLAVEYPYKLSIPCVLRRISCVATVAQTVKIHPGFACCARVQGLLEASLL